MRLFNLFVLIPIFTFSNWSHLELGAGNYGKFEVTYDPSIQYALLFWTLDELVARYGEEGLFYVNDINKDAAEYAAEQLTQYACERGYCSVGVTPLIGDYRSTSLPFPAEPLTSIHLKNPEIYFFGKQEHTQTCALLTRLAQHSQGGLHLFILDGSLFMPDPLRNLYSESTDWPPLPYYFPDGGSLEKGRVYFIPQGVPLQPKTSPTLP